MPALPFDDSRRLTGSNLFFPATGAVLEVVGVAFDDGLERAWRGNVARARRHLGWAEDAACAVRRHASGVSLALAAPLGGLFTATELNEWALCAALHDRDPAQWSGLRDALRTAAEQSDATPASPFPAEIDEPAALARLSRVAAREQRPDLLALIEESRSRDCPFLLDDLSLTLGAGATSRSFELVKLPSVVDVPWADLCSVPTALVTGSNGKTTTVRLVAACAQAQGWRAGYSCTDGVFVAGAVIETGDYSGPAGARRVLRDERVEAAVLETARGGILRRGLAVSRADVAVVTNVSADHFGEYGIHDLEALADVKLTVGSVVPEDGLLVLNADDALLRAKAAGLGQRFGRCPPLAWFAADADAPHLAAHRAQGGSTCGVRAGRLVLAHHGAEHDLGEIERMPLTVSGRARYNVVNLAAAALAAAGLGVPAATVAEVFRRFGERVTDNPGRLMRFARDGVQVLVDYAHNPEGLAGLLEVAASLRGDGGQLGLVLGHAGNRGDRDIERLAETAAQFAPALVVVKELEGYLRGREPGEVPCILRAALLRAGLPGAALKMQSTELDAVRCALEWGRPGDVLALPVHGLAARAAVLELLQK
jgi:UDP-N-acetylmuramyl tripeptide synthase